MTGSTPPVAGPVTGASSGIGEATALALAGASVVLGARRTDKLQSLAQKTDEYGVKSLVVELEGTDQDAGRAAVAKTATSSAVDIVVNSAGLMLLGPMGDADTEDWRRRINTNVLGLMYVTRPAVPGRVEQGSGHIVNISSIARRAARSGAGVYSASKWAVSVFSASLRQEVTAKGGKVTIIEPGAVQTELNDHIANTDVKKASEDNYNAMDSLQASDIAAAIVYAATQPARVAVNEILIRPTNQTQP